MLFLTQFLCLILNNLFKYEFFKRKIIRRLMNKRKKELIHIIVNALYCTWISTCTMHMNPFMYNEHKLIHVQCTWIVTSTMYLNWYMYNVQCTWSLLVSQLCIFWLIRKMSKPESSFAIVRKFEQVCFRIILGE